VRFLIVVSILPLLTLLWWWRADVLARGSDKRWVRVLVAAAAVMSIGAFAGIFLGVRWAPMWAWVFVWFLIVLPATLIVMGLAAGGRVASRVVRKPQPEAEPGPTRRAFLATAAVAPPVTALAGAGVGLTQIDEFRVNRIEVPIAGLPPELEGMRIAHVSDTHVGTFTRGPVLRDIVDAVNDAKADLVVHTGDILNRELTDLPEAADMITSFRGFLGVLNVEGNHDLFEGRRAFRDKAGRLGVDLMVNERRTLLRGGRAFDVLGLEWPRQRNDAGVLRSFDDAPPVREGVFTICLAHHPHAFDVARDRGIGLTLAGHTHGGQLMLPGDIGFGPLMYRYWSGLYTEGGAAAVINNGTGNWFPLRTFAPAEVGVLTLRRARVA
jgi:predicted MPP superfamily phosphohydrolase